MGLFGFGKKKEKQQNIKSEQKHIDTESKWILVNGSLELNPNYIDPEPEQSTEQMMATRVSEPEHKTWSEDIDHFLARNTGSKLVKLTGKPEEFSSYEVGNRCRVEEDDENDGKYNVMCGDDFIGRLPSSAVTYAEKHDCPPDDLAVIIAEIDYDFEKDRDIISVYISD